MKDREIFVYQATPRLHSHGKLMYGNPPKRYKFIINANEKKMNLLNFMLNSKIIKFIYRNIVKKFVNPLKLYDKVYSADIPESAGLVFSEASALSIKKPWVMQIIDSIYAISGNDYSVFIKNKGEIEKKLASEYCKKILVVNESTLKDMKKYFGREIMNKTILLRAAVEKQNIERNYNRKKLQLLFMGSIANPDDFIIKGGLEALECFKRLSKEYKNLSFVVRCNVPEKIKERYGNVANLQIIDQKFDLKQVKQLYLDTDILVNPAHIYPLMTTLEALSFGIPIVMLDTYGVRDYLQNGKNAILVKPSDKITSYNEEAYPANIRSRKFISEIEEVDEEVVGRLYGAVKRLVENQKLREKLGRYGKKTAENKFSIELRNKKLKKIFDECFEGS